MADGQAAVDAWQREVFDVIFMDCQMPVLDGYAATRVIRQLEKGTQRHTPIIACTAHAMQGAADPCFDAGMDAYMTKPVDRGALAQMLQRFIGARRLA